MVWIQDKGVLMHRIMREVYRADRLAAGALKKSARKPRPNRADWRLVLVCGHELTRVNSIGTTPRLADCPQCGKLRREIHYGTGGEKLLVIVGDRVRSFDFPDGRRNSYVDGVIEGIKQIRGCPCYRLRVTKRVAGGEVLAAADTPRYVYPPVNGTPSLAGVCRGVEKLT
jgi:hypothetical protein